MTTMVVSPGATSSYPTLKIKVAGDTALLSIATLQDVTVNAGKDSFTYQQLNSAGKFVIPTTANNSLSGNIVVDDTAFWGTGTGTDVAIKDGIFKLSADGQLVSFEFEFDAATGTGKKISGNGYITGIAPTVSPDSPVWVSPITISVLGSYTIASLS